MGKQFMADLLLQVMNDNNPPQSPFFLDTQHFSTHTHPTPLFITKISLSKQCLEAEMEDKRHNRREVRQEKWGEKRDDAGGVRQQRALNAALVGPRLQRALALYHLLSVLCAKLHLFSNSTGFQVDLLSSSEDKRRVCCITSKHYCF